MQKSVPEEHDRQDSFIVLKQMALKELSQHQDKVDISKCYVRALIDDDTYCTTFGKWRDNQLEWQDAIFLPLK
jgi:hypothetical protein